MKRDYRTAVLSAVDVNGDERSVSSDCSTVAVACVKQARRTVPNTRRVQFNEALNQVHHDNDTPSSDDDNEEESSSTWYSDAEMKQFKANTYALAREIYRLEHQLDNVHAYSNVIAATYNACCRGLDDDVTPLTATESQQLQKWMQVGTCRLGVERLCIKAVAADRRQRRNGIVDAVMQVQESLGYRVDCDLVVAKTAAAWSRPSRLFARELARACAGAL